MRGAVVPGWPQEDTQCGRHVTVRATPTASQSSTENSPSSVYALSSAAMTFGEAVEARSEGVPSPDDDGAASPSSPSLFAAPVALRDVGSSTPLRVMSLGASTSSIQSLVRMEPAADVEGALSPALTPASSPTPTPHGSPGLRPADGVIVVRTKRRLSDEYEMLNPIGHGTFSTVHAARHRGSGVLRAAKVLDRRRLRFSGGGSLKHLLREVAILRELEHPNIIRVLDVFEEVRRAMCLVRVWVSACRTVSRASLPASTPCLWSCVH